MRQLPPSAPLGRTIARCIVACQPQEPAAWHHAIALSVGVFFAVYVGLLLQSAEVAASGTAVVAVLTLLFWYAGMWPALASCILAVVGWAMLAAVGSAQPQPQREPSSL